MDPISLLGIGAFLFAILSIFFATRYSNKKKERLTDILKIDQMTDVHFAVFLKEMLEKGGYDVEFPRPTEEFGPLLFTTMNDERVIIRPLVIHEKGKKEMLLEMPAAREHFEADQVLVASNGYFRRSAKDFAFVNEITLFNRDELSTLTQHE